MKKYFKITSNKSDVSDVKVVGYHHGINYKSTKLYKDTKRKFDTDEIHGMGVEIISRVQFLKESGVGLLLHPKQKEFLESIKRCYTGSGYGEKLIYRKIKQVISEEVYLESDSLFLNDLLRTHKENRIT